MTKMLPKKELFQTLKTRKKGMFKNLKNSKKLLKKIKILKSNTKNSQKQKNES